MLVALLLTLCVLIAVSPVSAAESMPVEELVEQLGADDFAIREQAAEALVRLGEEARTGLHAGLEAGDLQVRRSCRRLLDEIADSSFQRRVRALEQDETGSAEHDLPGWREFRATIGHDPAAKKLFVAMLRAEPGLMESYAAGTDASLSALQLRLLQLRTRRTSGKTKQVIPPSIESLAAVAFVASDAEHRPPVNELNMLLNHLFQQDKVREVQSGPQAEPLQRLFSHLIRSSREPGFSQTALRLAVTLKLKDAGIEQALSLVRDARSHPSTTVAGGIGVLSVLGGKPFAAALVPLLDDERSCSARIINRKRMEIQVRDVAAAWLIHVTKQSLDSYQLTPAKNWFQSVDRNPLICFSVSSIYFPDTEARDKSLQRLTTWLEENPLPTIALKVDSRPVQSVVRNRAQNPEQNKTESPVAASQPRAGISLADYDVLARLREAKRLIAEERYGEAVGHLGILLENDQEFVFQPADTTTLFRSVKAEAELLLGGLPSTGQQEYELQFGPLARKKLDDALVDFDVDRLTDVQQRYFHTQAGRHATYLLAIHFRSRGSHHLAAMNFDRLQRSKMLPAETRAFLELETATCWLAAGESDAAREALLRWKAAWPHTSVALAGREVAIFREDDQALAWLQEHLNSLAAASTNWLVWAGDVCGAKPASGAVPFPKVQGLAGSENDAFVDRLLKESAAELEQRRAGILPTVQPLFVDGMLIGRSATALTALDLASGKTCWSVPAENGLNHLLRYVDPGKRSEYAEEVQDGLGRRWWHDLSWGAISSNRRLVFAIEDLGFHVGHNYQRIVTRMDGSRQLDADSFELSNCLSAYDVHSGKLVWQAGSAFGEETDSLAGGRFLGPPLPLNSRLYAVVEFADQTRLVQLKASDGTIEKHWILDVRETGASHENGTFTNTPTDIISNAPPVFSRGTVVCSSTEQKFFAVDVVNGLPLWSYQIEQASLPMIPGLPAMRSISDQQRAMTRDRWSATAALISGDRVLLTAVDSDHLHCVSLRSGQPLWRVSRGDGLFVAGVWDDMVVIVGRSGVTGRRLQDGQPVWQPETLSFAGGTVPAGRGYYHGGRYFLPMQNGEIVGIDVVAGRVASRIKIGDTGRLGNLVPTPGGAVFDGLSQIQRLAFLPQQPDDTGRATPLELAQTARAAGDNEQAIGQLLTARQSNGGPEVDHLLIEVLLDTVAAKTETYGQFETIIAALQMEHPQRYADWLTLADRLIAARELSAAWAVMQRTLAAPMKENKPVAASAARLVRSDRWLAGGLQELQAVVSASGDSNVPAEEIAAALQRLRPNRAAKSGTSTDQNAEPDGKASWMWNTAEFDVKVHSVNENKSRDALRTGQLLPVLVESDESSEFAGLVASYDARSRTLTAIDSYGVEICSLVLPAPAPQNAPLVNPYYAAVQGVVVGHVFIFHRGDIVVALDCRDEKKNPLWIKEVWPDGGDPTLIQWFMNRRMRNRMFGQVAPNRSIDRSVAGTADFVCFQTGENLVAVELLSGQVLWSRDDLQFGCDLVAGEEYIAATPPDAEYSVLLSAVDGRRLGTRPAIDSDERLAVYDGRVLVSRPDAKPPMIGLYDPRRDDFVWRRELRASEKIAVAGEDLAIVHADSGQLVLIDARSGQLRWTADVDGLVKLDDVSLIRFRDRLVLAAHRTTDNNAAQQVFGMPQLPGTIALSGGLFGFDRNGGKLLWKQDVENQTLRIDQPARLPLLILCSRVHRRVMLANNTWRYDQPSMILQCFDVRDGKPLVDDRSEHRYHAQYALTIDHQRQTANIETAGRTVELTPGK